MGVFKWLRRERVTVTTSQHQISPIRTTPENRNSFHENQTGTIRTEEYKRDLAEFQARRSLGNRELPDTPEKKKCGRHSISISCTDCAVDPDNTFNQERKSAGKYKKRSHKTRKAVSEEKDGLPNIQFLFQNQVFMPGNVISSYSDPQKKKRHRRSTRSPVPDSLKQINFDNNESSPPLFYKNNSLPVNIEQFLDMDDEEEEVDGPDFKAAGDKGSAHSSSDMSKDGKFLEAMSELKDFDKWADEQLQAVQSANSSRLEKSFYSKSDSAFGLPIASTSDLDFVFDRKEIWNTGKWGPVPVHIKEIKGVTLDHVRKKLYTEINILRKCRHPNIILLMGFYPALNGNVHIVCERFVDTLHGILHIQGRILSVQTSVQYGLDIANALVFLRMHGFIHTQLNSLSVIVTNHDAAKLADLGPCVRYGKAEKIKGKAYDTYSSEPQYVNIEDTQEPIDPEYQPLITANPSDAYLASNAISKDYNLYRSSEQYRWQAPELFEADECGTVKPCSKSDVYSLCLIVWECCNAALPWKTLSYDKLKELYTLWQTGIRLPRDGTYPGCLLSLLQEGLKLNRSERSNLDLLQKELHNAKLKLDELEYIIIPARLNKKKSNFSSVGWDTTSHTDTATYSPTPGDLQHSVLIREDQTSSTESFRDKSTTEKAPIYETIRKPSNSEPVFISDDEIDGSRVIKYEYYQEKEYCSPFSTPIAKVKARINDLETPGRLHKSDSTEYCSILSPNRTNLGFEDDIKDKSSIEKPVSKLCKSFTPKSYKPLQIEVPDYNCDSIKSLPKKQTGDNVSSYKFDIRNYSLPTTPIARSNKLRKNAWLSGDAEFTRKSQDNIRTDESFDCNKESKSKSPDTPAASTNSSLEKGQSSDNNSKQLSPGFEYPESIDTIRDSVTGLKRTGQLADSCSPDTLNGDKMGAWTFEENNNVMKYKIEEDVLANVNVKPLVAIHERWIYEANKKTCRSMSLPEEIRLQNPAVKPASHCVDTLQKSLPQLTTKKSNYKKSYRMSPVSSIRNGGSWEKFCQARESVAKNMNFNSHYKDVDRFATWKKDANTSTSTESFSFTSSYPKVDQATDTENVEDFIKEMIRKEFQHILDEMSEDVSLTHSRKRDEILNKGVTNIMESLKHVEDCESSRKDNTKSFSRVKINGNNKPLLQITFNRNGENSLQVLDGCVNVTISDNNANDKDKMNVSSEDTLTPDDFNMTSLKRCQTFNAIQEARSTEDLYIDDDLSTMQDNFGGKVKLIPLHGSLHEILCEKEDECCLIKVKQENGCDTIYFKCDNSDTESRDAIDGADMPQDTVVYKRSISLVEERIQRVFPKDKRTTMPSAARKPQPEVRKRPKSEIILKRLNKETKFKSASSPSLNVKDKNEDVEINIESTMCYQDSSSDECLRCQENDEFEILEKRIEEDVANGSLSMTCGCLEKISEENLSLINEEIGEKLKF